jgi:predicted RNA-binding protein (virulence factor B family)
MAFSDLEINEKIDVFVYHDGKDSQIATTKFPYAEVGEYALLRVIETKEFGAFFDFGIEKDLLVPGNEQKFKVKIYEDHIVRICLEEETCRIYGTTKLGKYIEESDFDIEDGSKVEIIPAQETDLGYKSIINNKFIGMIYHSEIFSKIQIGKKYSGVIKKIRKDGLVDAALQTQGINNLYEAKETILNALRSHSDTLPLHDKSTPESIKKMLGMSKKTFKNAIGMLYKERLIKINSDSIQRLKHLGPKK